MIIDDDFLGSLIEFIRKERDIATNEMRTWNEAESFYASGKRTICERILDKIGDLTKAE